MSGRLKKFSIYPPAMMLSLYFAVFSYMVPIMMEAFSMNYKQAGVISTVQFLGAAIAQLLSFTVFSALNKSRIIFISLLAVTACLVWVGFNKVLFMLYVLFFFRGVFGSTANTLSNAYVADIFERRREFYVGLYHALAAGAAVIGPYLALSLVNDFAMSFGVTALIIGASAALFWFGMRHEIKKPMVQNRANFGGFGKLFRMLRIKNMALILLLILFASFIQNIVVLYISSYGMEIGTQADGAFLLAMFLGGLFAGSLLYSIVAHKFSTIQIMIYANIVSFGALVAMLLCSGSLTIGMLSLAGGVFFGANMPGLFVELAKMVPEDSGAVSAFLFLGNIIAGLAAPVMVGAIADEIGMRWALMISMVFFVPILLLLLVWKRRHGGLLAADADLKRTVNVVE